MKSVNKIFLIQLLLFLLPSCGRIIDWGKESFYQGEDLKSFTDQVVPDIRSVTIYDQLETKASFEVLWLTDQVRTAYAELHAMRYSKDADALNAMLRRQLEENNHFITFYLLSTHEVKLGDPESHWSFTLKVDEQEYQPMEIKEIELPYEYQIFFGKRWNRFKVPYVIRFRAEDLEENEIINEQTMRVSLMARSALKEHDFVWQLVKVEQPKKLSIAKRKKKKKSCPPKERIARKRRK